MGELLTREELDKIGQVLEYGSKIQAIKIYREATGQGLKEAKEFVDGFSRELIKRDPERYRRLEGSPAGTVVAIVIPF